MYAVPADSYIILVYVWLCFLNIHFIVLIFRQYISSMYDIIHSELSFWFRTCEPYRTILLLNCLSYACVSSTWSDHNGLRLLLTMTNSKLIITLHYWLSSAYLDVNRAGGSMDTEMNRLHLHVDTPCSKSAKKSVFGSIERSMDKLLCMLTPKKKPCSPDKPRSVKVCWRTSLLICAFSLMICRAPSMAPLKKTFLFAWARSVSK